MHRVASVIGLALLLLSSPPVCAGKPDPVQHRRHGRQYRVDLSGVGTATVYGLRGAMKAHRVLVIEAQIAYAPLGEDFGFAKLSMQDAQFHAQLPVGRFAPNVGVGGIIVEDPLYPTDSDITASASAGLRVNLPGRLGLLGEVRLRGVGTRFTGSTGDWTVGIAYRI